MGGQMDGRISTCQVCYDCYHSKDPKPVNNVQQFNTHVHVSTTEIPQKEFIPQNKLDLGVTEITPLK